MRLKTRLVRFWWCVFASSVAFASPLQQPLADTTTSSNAAARLRLSTYVLGVGDEITISCIGAEEISNKPIRISNSGDINLQLVGRIRAAGMKVEELEAELAERLKVFIRDPQVVVALQKSNSEPVSVQGAVAKPGIIQLEGQKTLIEVISLAGGLTTDAAPLIKITRRSEWGRIPVVSARTEGNFSIAEINYTGILNTTRPEENIQILPHDIISVPRAPLIYVIGDVRSPGGFVLNGKITVSLIEALARAGGMQPTAQGKQAKIIRPVPGANRIEIAVNLNKVLDGKTKDVMLEPDDILYVPSSAVKSTLRRTLDQIIGTTLGVAVYRF